MPRKSKLTRHLAAQAEKRIRGLKKRKREEQDTSNNSVSDTSCIPSSSATSLPASPIASTSILSLPGISASTTSLPGTSTSTASFPLTSPKRCVDIRRELLGGTQIEDSDSDSDCIILTKRRLRDIVTAECICQENSYHVRFSSDAFETTVTRYCAVCAHKSTSMPSECVPYVSDTYVQGFLKTNVSLVYLSILEDYGFAGIKRMQGVLGMPIMGSKKYYKHMHFLYNAMNDHFAVKQNEVYMAIKSYYENQFNVLPDENGIVNIDISFDGTWMKRGHTSHVGMGVIIEVCTGFVIDYEVLNKFCSTCKIKENEREKISEEEFAAWKILHAEKCAKNYVGTSGGMEQEGAKRMFARSETHGFRYVTFVGDGDSSTYRTICAMNNGEGPYSNIKVTKLECVNHVQKRMSARLRKLRDEEQVEITTKTGKKMKRSLLGGKNKLSDATIATLTSFYGNAIRQSIGKPYPEMKKAVMATFHHIFSTKEDPRHTLRPTGIYSWCYYQSAIACGEDMNDIEFKRSSTVIDVDAESECKIKSIYEALSTKDLLIRCVRGLTQNANESFHSKIWRRAHKIKFAGPERVRFVARTTILDHNFGYQKACVLKYLGINSSSLEHSLKLQEKRRIMELTPKEPKNKNDKKKKDNDYNPGGF